MSTSTRDPSETLDQIEKMLAEHHNDEELIKSMDLLIPVIMGLFTSSPHWLVRDRALESLRLINQKMGKSIIYKHLNTISKKNGSILKHLLL